MLSKAVTAYEDVASQDRMVKAVRWAAGIQLC